MAFDPQSLLNLQDLRAIVHALKMDGLSSVDPEALDNIKERIQGLPSAEAMSQVADNPLSLKSLREEIGAVFQLIETYGKRDPEFKARYKSRTGLPPRYKVLEWRKAMKKEARQIVREVIKISAVVDDKGQGRLSADLIRCAKQIQSEEMKEKDFNILLDNLRSAGLEAEANLLKEAAFPWVQNLQDAWSAGKETLKDKGSGFEERFNVLEYERRFKGIERELGEMIPEVRAAYIGAKDPDRSEKLRSVFQKMQNMKMIVDEIGSDWEIIQGSFEEEEVAPEKVMEPEVAPDTVVEPEGVPAAASVPLDDEEGEELGSDTLYSEDNPPAIGRA